MYQIGPNALYVPENDYNALLNFFIVHPLTRLQNYLTIEITPFMEIYSALNQTTNAILTKVWDLNFLIIINAAYWWCIFKSASQMICVGFGYQRFPINVYDSMLTFFTLLISAFFFLMVISEISSFIQHNNVQDHNYSAPFQLIIHTKHSILLFVESKIS